MVQSIARRAFSNVAKMIRSLHSAVMMRAVTASVFIFACIVSVDIYLSMSQSTRVFVVGKSGFLPRLGSAANPLEDPLPAGLPVDA